MGSHRSAGRTATRLTTSTTWRYACSPLCATMATTSLVSMLTTSTCASSTSGSSTIWRDCLRSHRAPEAIPPGERPQPPRRNAPTECAVHGRLALSRRGGVVRVEEDAVWH
eukprot:810419-Prymnesium_polylepis.1